MGYWNGTCILSRLPILHGDRTKLLLVAPRGRDYQRSTSCCGHYAPVCPPLSGKYDDYGGIEDIDPDGSVGFLGFLPLRFRTNGKDPGTGLPLTHAPDMAELVSGPGWEHEIRNLVGYALRGDLEVLVSDGPGPESWRPVMVQLVLEKFWDMACDANMPEAPDPSYLGSTDFRLMFLGPVRRALSRLDPVWGSEVPADAPVMAIDSAVRFQALFAAMDGLRCAFGPTAGAGGQDRMDYLWQRDMYLAMWLEAEAINWRCENRDLPAFSAAAGWDGTALAMDRNAVPCGYPDLPEDYCALRPAILAEAVRNLMAAIREADEKA